MKKHLVLVRTLKDDKKTLGDLRLLIEDNVILMLKTLELPWKNNKRKVSCIPEGTYAVKVHTSPKFGWCLWLQDVPQRDAILVHGGNFTRQILGCILPGIIHTDMDKDGITDVKHSTVAMEALQYYIGDTKELTIQIRS